MCIRKEKRNVLIGLICTGILIKLAFIGFYIRLYKEPQKFYCAYATVQLDRIETACKVSRQTYLIISLRMIKKIISLLLSVTCLVSTVLNRLKEGRSRMNCESKPVEFELRQSSEPGKQCYALNCLLDFIYFQ